MSEQNKAANEQRVLIVGTGSPIPSFIFRRLRKLDELGQPLVIACSPEWVFMFDQFRNAEILRYKTLNRGGIGLFMSLLLKWMHPFTDHLWRFAKGATFFAKLKWVIENHQLTRAKRVGAIHMQWIVMVESFSWMGKFYNVPIVASARGSQVTVHLDNNEQRKEVIRRCFSLCKYVHCVSEDIAQKVLALGALNEQIIVNYNGVDPQKFNRRIQNRNETSLKLVSVGALMWRKGYIFQLQIVKTLKVLNFKPHLTLVGSGEDFSGLRYLAANLGIGDCVVFRGQLDEAEVLEVLAESDIYLSTSVAEGLSNSVAEACCIGLPCVVFDCEGMNELIEDQASGFIVKFGDISAMVQRIQELARNPALTLEMGKQARAKMIRQFDEGQWVNKMMEFYKALTRSEIDTNS